MDDDDDWDDAFLSTIDALETSHLQQKQATHTGQHGDHAQHPPVWACRSCTLNNTPDRVTCQMCNTPRGATYQPQQAPQTHAHPTSSGRGPTTSSFFAPAPTQAVAASQSRKTVQATLPFGKPAGVPSTSGTATALSRASTSRRALANPTTTQPRSLGFPPRNGAANIHGEPDEIDEPDPAVALARIAKLRHKGEDVGAKMRYYTDAEMGASRPPSIDHETAASFVYPTNYSVREYQLTIAEKALYHNTLVSLPTGLGKTLIASVVMYNFYRWFPQGQIVFMAPTKPLVAQQIGACHEIMGIPLSDTAELQGSVPPPTRKVLWSTKRVFFCTPQSMQNDLQRGICRAERLVCLVVDEAHRATGNYAYCNVIHEVEKRTKQFRILALSATPGSKFDVIQDVIRNLRITHIESRSADDADVKKYTHARQEEVIKCSLTGQISEAKALFMQVFQRITQRLLVQNIIQHKDPERLTKYYVLQARERFRTSPNYQTNRRAESDLALLISLLHARDLLTGHGLASFKECIDDFVTEEQRSGRRPSWSKKELLESTEFQSLRLSLEHVSTDNELTNPSSHPKLLKLRDVLHEHFQRHAMGQSSTRAIVFTQYRSSVQEIVKLLVPLAPLVLAQQFVGQGASGKSKESKGQTQKEQQEIVRKFRAGLFNVLVATCIAEEGLDIGEVDLIVSFDALSSPVRMIQRMGRTGRKRVGKVIILVTEGDEEKKLARGVSAAKSVSRALTQFKSKFVYGKCPRMLPPGCVPTLTALEMVIPEFHASQVAGKQQSTRTSSRSGADDSTAREKKDMSWKLNDLEKSITRTRYLPSAQWAETPRHEFVPIAASRKILLRRRCPDDGPSSARSLVLLKLVRKMNGVEYDDEELEQPGPRSEQLHPPVPLPSIGVYDENEEMLAFSDPEDLHDNHMHFSPQYSGLPATAIEPTTPTRVHGLQQPTSHTKQPSEQKKLTPSTGNQNQAAGSSVIGSGVKTSPLRQATMTGKPSPSPGRKKSLGSGKKAKKRLERPKDAIDESLLERGERLLQQLNAMVMSDATTTATDMSSPEPEPQVVEEETKDHMESPLQFPRIARRLEFGQHSKDNNIDCFTTLRHRKENCVPLPPTESELFSFWRNKPRVNPSELVPALSEVEKVESKSLSASHSVQPSCNGQDQARNELLAHLHGSSLTAPEIEDRTIQSTQSMQAPAMTSPAAAMQSLVPGTNSVGSRASLSTMYEIKKPRRSLALRKAPSASDHDAVENTDSMPKETFAVGPTPANAAQKPTAKAVMERTQDAFVSRHADIRSSDTPTQLLPSTFESQGHTQRSSAKSNGSQDDPCSICCENESFDDDPIVFCDGCNTAVHQFCYGIPELPTADWFCDLCHATKPQGTGKAKAKTYTDTSYSCALCPIRAGESGGAMKQTQCGRWVHVQCFLWIPELQFHFETKTLRLGTIDRLDPDRKALRCSLCNSKRGGGVIQCTHKRCLSAFHVSCASAAASDNFRLVQLDQDEGQDCKTLFVAYCPLHGNSKSLWKPLAPAAKSQASPARKVAATPATSPFPRAPPSARSPGTALSPSALLMSQADSTKKQRKQFRRLKRKYDVAMPSQSTTTQHTPPTAHSPWTKRVKRSEKHTQVRRAHAKAIAQMFIEDEVDAPGNSEDDDDHDDEMDEEDTAFINDSSQLIYSPSLPTPVRKKKCTRNSLGDMRAIYARSLFESPQTPAFLRRGRRMLPSGGIISACLQEMHDESEVSSAFLTPGASSQECEERGDHEERNDIIEIMEESEPQTAVESTPIPTRDDQADGPAVEKSAAPVSVPPCFDLLNFAAATTISSSTDSTAMPFQPELQAVKDDSRGDDDEQRRQVSEKIEANRVKALRLLEAKQQAAQTTISRATTVKEMKANDPSIDPRSLKKPGASENDRHHGDSDETARSTRLPEPSVNTARRAVDASPPSFSLLGTVVATPSPSIAKSTQPSPPVSVPRVPTTCVVVHSSFRQSPVYPRMESTMESVGFQADTTLEVDALLSFRVAMLSIDVSSAHAPSLQPHHDRIEILKSVFKQFVVVVLARDAATAQEFSRSPPVQQLRALPTCRSVIITSDPTIICKALLAVIRDECNLGFGFPCLGVDHPSAVSGGGVDAHFLGRLAFFRATRVLSLGSALSLSFRFDKFTVQQIPVAKFNEMHWRRMLPWVPEQIAKQLYGYFLRTHK